jgi:transposase
MKRRKFSPELKKKIALEAIREQRTINEIASSYEIHPVQVSKWKKDLLDGAISVFENPKKREGHLKKMEERESLLHQKVGELTVENDFLKKKLGF